MIEMRQPATLREFLYPQDYPFVLDLWQSLEKGMTVGASDTPEEIEKKLQRDPDLFLVAESNRQIVGSIIGGFDGRRGMVYHLAVRTEYRKRGIASQLIQEIEKRLKAKGCLKCYLLVFADNREAIHLYEKLGWQHMQKDIIFGKVL